MTRRHYGIRVPKPRPTYTGPARAGAWSGSAFISVIVVILIVLGVILYGLSKTITDTANTTTSAPSAIGQGAQQAQPGLSNRAGRQYVGSERRRSRESRSANGAMLAPAQISSRVVRVPNTTSHSPL